MKYILALVLSMFFPVASSVYAQTGKRPTVPRLVLQITVDQLRGDLTRRYLLRAEMARNHVRHDAFEVIGRISRQAF